MKRMKFVKIIHVPLGYTSQTFNCYQTQIIFLRDFLPSELGPMKEATQHCIRNVKECHAYWVLCFKIDFVCQLASVGYDTLLSLWYVKYCFLCWACRRKPSYGWFLERGHATWDMLMAKADMGWLWRRLPHVSMRNLKYLIKGDILLN
jgi:hypothetical protein